MAKINHNNLRHIRFTFNIQTFQINVSTRHWEMSLQTRKLTQRISCSAPYCEFPNKIPYFENREWEA